MSLSRTLVGALIGAVVGLGLYIAFVAMMRNEAAWFAIIIGLLTGLGARQANKALASMVSYPSGALTAFIALAAIVGGLLLAPIVRAKMAAGPVSKPGSFKGAPAGDETTEESPEDLVPTGEQTAAEPAGEATVAAVAPPSIKPVGAEQPPNVFMEFFDIWQILFVAVGTFLAYELGRGKAGASRPATTA